MKKNKTTIIFFFTLFSASLYGNSMNMEKDFIPFGVNISYNNGMQYGGEISMVHFAGIWYGVYADSIYNKETDHWKFSFGPELGVLFAGIDAGLLLEKNHLGITGRFLLNYIIPHAYVRLNYLPHYNTSFEFGLLLKLPAPIK